jgi:hypothetical protein
MRIERAVGSEDLLTFGIHSPYEAEAVAISLRVASHEASWKDELNLAQRIRDRVAISKLNRLSGQEDVQAEVGIPYRHIGRMAAYLDRTYSGTEGEPILNGSAHLYSEGLRDLVEQIETERRLAGRTALAAVNSFLEND